MFKKIVIGAVTAGALSLGAVGVASAATTPSGGPSTAVRPNAGKHVDCANAGKALARIEKLEGRIAAGLPKLTAAEQKATQAGDTARAARIQKRITRLENPHLKIRLDKVSQRIEATCHVTAPATPGTAPTGGTGSTASVQA